MQCGYWSFGVRWPPRPAPPRPDTGVTQAARQGTRARSRVAAWWQRGGGLATPPGRAGATQNPRPVLRGCALGRRGRAPTPLSSALPGPARPHARRFGMGHDTPRKRAQDRRRGASRAESSRAEPPAAPCSVTKKRHFVCAAVSAPPRPAPAPLGRRVFFFVSAFNKRKCEPSCGAKENKPHYACWRLAASRPRAPRGHHRRALCLN